MSKRISTREGGAQTRLDSCRRFFFQAEDGIRDTLWSRGLGDVYKGQWSFWQPPMPSDIPAATPRKLSSSPMDLVCLLYTSDAADDFLRVDPGGTRNRKKKIMSKICIMAGRHIAMHVHTSQPTN